MAFVLTLAVFVGAGCKRDESAGPGAGQDIDAVVLRLEGATNVMEAFGRQDYEATVAALVAIKQNLTSEQQLEDFNTVNQHIYNKLAELSETDPKAAEGLAAMRTLTMGR